MQKEPNEKWAWIKHFLELRGLTFRKIAAKHGVDKSCFTKVKTVPMPKNERILADIVGNGVEPWDLWPDRYDELHNPCRISSRYQGHKHFLNSTQNLTKRNEKDNQKIKPLNPTPGAAE